MKVIGLASAALIALSTLAHAQDAAPTWNGAYFGGFGGFGFGTGEVDNAKVNGASVHYDGSDQKPDGFLGGVEVGYDWRLPSNFVIGAVADFAFADLSDSNGNHDSTDLNKIGTVRARVGYAYDRFMPYVTGGLAYGQVENKLKYVGEPSISDEQWQVGWAAGAGVDYAVTDKIVLKLEYLYTDLGTTDYSWTRAGGTAIKADYDMTTSQIKLGASYHF